MGVALLTTRAVVELACIWYVLGDNELLLLTGQCIEKHAWGADEVSQPHLALRTSQLTRMFSTNP